MGDRRCCCEEGECWEFEDNFAKEDTTDLGSDWNEATGTWGIEDEELVEQYGGAIGTGNAQLFCTQPVPERSAGEMYIEIKVKESSVEDGDEYRIWPCCTDTSTEGDIEVTFTYDETENKWTTVINGGNEGDSATYTVAATGTPTHITLKVCADHGNGFVKAWISPTANEFAAWDDYDPGTGRYAAIGHNNTTHQNVFDDYYMEELRTPTALCHNCFCRCNDEYVPTTLTATIIDAEDRAACLQDESWEMNVVLGPQAIQWEGGLVNEDGELNFLLTCGDGAPSSFSLYPLEPWGCHNTNVAKSADVAKSTCEPLMLYFGPYTMGFSMDCSLCYDKNQPQCVIPPPDTDCYGEFWILITE